MKGRLVEKVAFITGLGSSKEGVGNGSAISRLFAREGAVIFGSDLDRSAAERTKAAIEEEGGICEVAMADVSSAEQVQQAIETCIKRFGRIDILVNNVGIAEVGGVVDYPESKWQRDLAVNLTSMFLTCKYAIPHMIRQGGGSIINIGSIGGIRCTNVPLISYHTTKAAIIGFSRAVAIEHADKNIRSNVVMPGMMDTPMLTKGASGDTRLMKQAISESCPMGAMGTAWDVAEAVAYLASDQAKYVTATELVVDGGVTALYMNNDFLKKLK
jgi:NAD(P)-dependent dehydrogenase (short-subunit alcohol dehydrogenase family)